VSEIRGWTIAERYKGIFRGANCGDEMYESLYKEKKATMNQMLTLSHIRKKIENEKEEELERQRRWITSHWMPYNKNEMQKAIEAFTKIGNLGIAYDGTNYVCGTKDELKKSNAVKKWWEFWK